MVFRNDPDSWLRTNATRQRGTTFHRICLAWMDAAGQCHPMSMEWTSANESENGNGGAENAVDVDDAARLEEIWMLQPPEVS